jgi:prevent-host-death family protein
METIPLTEAKKRYDEIVERAANGERIVISRYGRETAVVMSIDEFHELSDK